MKHLFSLLLVAMIPGLALAQNVEPIVSEGVVDAPLERVWRAWTTTEGLKEWLAPHVDIDFRIGGAMRTNYDPNGSLDDPQTIINEVVSFEPEQKMTIRVKQAPANFPFPNAIYKMTTDIYFERIDDKHTKLRAVGEGFDTSEESQNMRKFFEAGNQATIVELQKALAPPTNP